MPRLPRRSGAASRASRAPKPRPSAPPSAICTTPVTQNDRGCAIVPREIKVDVTKCHACEIIVCLVCVCEVSVCVCGEVSVKLVFSLCV